LKLDRKEFKSASEGRKQQERIQSDIESIEAAMAGAKAKAANWEKKSDLVQRYSDPN
jgi:hypothetical protein